MKRRPVRTVWSNKGEDLRNCKAAALWFVARTSCIESDVKLRRKGPNPLGEERKSGSRQRKKERTGKKMIQEVKK